VAARAGDRGYPTVAVHLGRASFGAAPRSTRQIVRPRRSGRVIPV